MTITVGGAAGGGFITTSISPILQATAGSGIRATITPPDGKKIRIVYLRSNAVGGNSANIQLKIDGVAVKASGNVFSKDTLSLGAGTPNDWVIGSGNQSTTGSPESLAYVEGDIDQVITIEATGTMNNGVDYQFMEGF